jgi:3'(2'), 5'-bisphosphate nucleotidase
MPDHAALIGEIRAAALRAGAAILEVYAQDFAIERKSDASPVTQADHLAEAIIVETLQRITPGVAIVAEELAEAGGLPETAPERFWLVDPLDGTKEFIARNGEFTVNVALVENRRPVLGVVHAPALDVTYWAAAGGAFRRQGSSAATPIAARPVPKEGAVCLCSRSHADEAQLTAYLATLPKAQRVVSGSSIKFCLLAAGEADLYPRFGPTMEWDTAAGQAVLEAAGGRVTMRDGAPFLYGKPGFRNPDFIARGR